jgi:osmotically inducible lipoprotein OsmB
MKKLFVVLSTLLLSTSLMGCSSWNKQDTGTAVGAVGGAVVGNVIGGGSALGTGIGAVGGAIAGRQLSK